MHLHTRFTDTFDVKHHEMGHTVEKCHMCEVCGKYILYGLVLWMSICLAILVRNHTIATSVEHSSPASQSSFPWLW